MRPVLMPRPPRRTSADPDDAAPPTPKKLESHHQVASRLLLLVGATVWAICLCRADISPASQHILLRETKPARSYPQTPIQYSQNIRFDQCSPRHQRDQAAILRHIARIRQRVQLPRNAWMQAYDDLLRNGNIRRQFRLTKVPNSGITQK